MRTIRKQFRVAMKSSNTNSFGLHQMIVISKDGDAYKTHASMYNAPEVGGEITQTIKSDDGGIVVNEFFSGCELTARLPRPPKDVINEAWQ